MLTFEFKMETLLKYGLDNIQQHKYINLVLKLRMCCSVSFFGGVRNYPIWGNNMSVKLLKKKVGKKGV